MFRNILLIAFLFFLNKFGYAFSEELLFSRTSSYLLDNGMPLCAYALFGALFLMGGSYFLTNVGLYKVAYLLSTVVYQVTSFLIMALSFLHGWLWLAGEYHLFNNGGSLGLLALFLLLIASLLTLKVIDFNYHIQNALINNIAVVVIAVLFVELIGPLLLG